MKSTLIFFTFLLLNNIAIAQSIAVGNIIKVKANGIPENEYDFSVYIQ